MMTKGCRVDGRTPKSKALTTPGWWTGGPGLVDEACHHFLLRDPLGMEDLHRRTPAIGMPGLEDPAEAPLPHLADDAIAADITPWDDCAADAAPLYTVALEGNRFRFFGFRGRSVESSTGGGRGNAPHALPVLAVPAPR